MKLKTTQPNPSHELELTHEELREALLPYLRRKLKGAPAKLPKGAEVSIEAVAHGSQSCEYIGLDDSCGTLTIKW